MEAHYSLSVLENIEFYHSSFFNQIYLNTIDSGDKYGLSRRLSGNTERVFNIS